VVLVQGIRLCCSYMIPWNMPFWTSTCYTWYRTYCGPTSQPRYIFKLSHHRRFRGIEKKVPRSWIINGYNCYGGTIGFMETYGHGPILLGLLWNPWLCLGEVTILRGRLDAHGW